MPKDDLEQSFPGLRTGHYQVTSPADNTYNCVAWAAHDAARRMIAVGRRMSPANWLRADGRASSARPRTSCMTAWNNWKGRSTAQ
jgi:hypothetical protein